MLQYDTLNIAALLVCVSLLGTPLVHPQLPPKPSKRLLTGPTVWSLLLLALLLPLQQGLAQLALHRQPWYASRVDQVIVFPF